MILKLIKHDLKAILPDFYVVYLILGVLALVGPFLLRVSSEWLIAVFSLVVIGTFIAVSIITLLAILNLFNKRLFSHQGYLSMTLPVSTTSLLISKILTALIISLITSLITMMSIMIFVAILTWMAYGDLEQFRVFFDIMSQSNVLWKIIGLFVSLAPVTLLDSTYSLVLLLFVVTFVHTSYVRKNRLLIGVILYLGIAMLLSTIQTNVFNLPMVTWSGDMELLIWAVGPDMRQWLPQFLDSIVINLNWINIMIWIGYFIALIGILFSFTQVLIERKLEVD